MALPQVLIQYSLQPVPHMMAAKWLAPAFVENMLLGVLVAAIYGKTSAAGLPAQGGEAP